MPLQILISWFSAFDSDKLVLSFRFYKEYQTGS